MRRSLLSVLFVLALLAVVTNGAGAGSKGAAEFSGLSFQPRGQGSLTVLPGPPPQLVAVIPGAGDGLAMPLGPGGGGIEWAPFFAPSAYGDGPFFNLTATATVDGVPDQTAVQLDVDILGTRAVLTASFPALSSGGVRVEIYDDGNLVRTLNSPSLLRADAVPLGAELLRTAVPADAPSMADPSGGAGRVPSGMRVRFPQNTGFAFDFGKGDDEDDEEGDEMFIIPAQSFEKYLTRFHEMEFMVDRPGLGTLEVVAANLTVDAIRLTALGSTSFLPLSDGAKLLNLAGCGQSGVSMTLEDHWRKLGISFEEVLLKGSGAECIDVALLGDLGAGEVVLATAQAARVASTVELSADFSGVAATGRAIYYNDGQVAAVPPPGASNVVLETTLPTGTGSFFAGQFDLGFLFRFDPEVTMQAPFGGTVQVDEVHLILNSPAPPYVASRMDLTFGGSGIVEDIVLRYDGPRGVVPDSTSVFSLATVLGQGAINRGGGNLLALTDRKDLAPGASLVVEGMPQQLEVVTRSVDHILLNGFDRQDIEAFIEPAGLSPRSGGSMVLRNNHIDFTFAVDYSSMNAVTARVVVMNDGQFVDQFAGLSFGDVATVGNSRLPSRVAIEEYPSTMAPYGYTVFLDDGSTITVPGISKRSATGNEIRILVENPIAPLQSVVLWNTSFQGTESVLVTHVTSSVATAVPPQTSVVSRLRLAPNPFNPRTRVSFELENDADVSLRVYSLDGRLVDTIHRGWIKAGEQSFTWDGRDRLGREVASGSYFLRLNGPGIRATGRAVLLK